MKNFEEAIAEAKRIEIDEKTGKLYIVFEVINEAYRQKIKNEWHKDLEFKLIDKNLFLKED